MKIDIITVVILSSSLIPSSKSYETNFVSPIKYYEIQAARTRTGIYEPPLGTPATPGQFPWQAAVYQNASWGPFCGGTLIGREWVLTAAHCVINVTHVYVELGSLKVDASDDDNKIVFYTCCSYIVHPEYKMHSQTNDVALIYLPEAVNYTKTIKAIALSPVEDTIGGNVNVTVTGWGKTQRSGQNFTNALYYVNLTTMKNSECATFYGNKTVIPSVLCAASKKRRSPCTGDSGGPLVMYEENKEPVLVGIVNFINRYGCSRGYPSGYARLQSFRNWIYENTGI